MSFLLAFPPLFPVCYAAVSEAVSEAVDFQKPAFVRWTSDREVMFSQMLLLHIFPGKLIPQQELSL